MMRPLATLVAIVCLAAAFCTPVRSAPIPPAKIVLGDEVFLHDTWRDLHGRCIGIVTNQTGVTSQLESIVDAVRRNKSICLRALYAPEHGLRGDRPAGAYVPSYTDPHTGLPVYSLYGPTRKPNAAMLQGVDVLLFDIQDVGSGVYTYISTLAYVMQAAKTFGKEVWVLDRPNPTGGEIVEGPVTEPRFASFIRLYPIAMRHAMTVGELARLYNTQFGIGANMRVIAMQRWKRSMLWPDTGLVWVQTSPNIPHWETTLVYPATGLDSVIGINEGANFTKPFEVAGAAGVDAFKLANMLNARSIPGVHFRPTSWSPVSGLYAGKELTGVELLVVDPHAFENVRTAVEIAVAMRELNPHVIQAGNVTGGAVDRDWGTDAFRLGLTRGESVEAIIAAFAPALRTFEAERTKVLLY